MSVIGPIRYLTVGNSTYEIYNTDTKLTQTTATASGYTYWRPLVIGYSSASTEGTAPTTQTNTTYTFSTLMVQPSSGTIRFGKASLYNEDYTVSLSADTLTTNRSILVPDSDGTLALTTDIHSIPSGGTSGQVLKKSSATDYAVEWGAIDALPSVTSSDNGKVLTVVSGAWAAASLPLYNGGVS